MSVCKKLGAIVCGMLCSAVLMAQTSVSLDVGYGNQGYSYMEQEMPAYDGSLPRGQSCYLAPRLGYTWANGVGMGLQLGVGYSSLHYAEGYYDPIVGAWQQSGTTTNDLFSVTASAYLRVRCYAVGSLSLHMELSGSYGMGWGNDIRNERSAIDASYITMRRHTEERSIRARLLPVICYAFGDHVDVDLYLNIMALAFDSTTTDRWPYAVGNMPEVDTPQSTTTEQGFNIGLNALNTSMLTLGFRYNF